MSISLPNTATTSQIGQSFDGGENRTLSSCSLLTSSSTDSISNYIRSWDCWPPRRRGRATPILLRFKERSRTKCWVGGCFVGRKGWCVDSSKSPNPSTGESCRDIIPRGLCFQIQLILEWTFEERIARTTQVCSGWRGQCKLRQSLALLVSSRACEISRSFDFVGMSIWGMNARFGEDNKKAISTYVGTRTITQIRSHLQKFKLRLVSGLLSSRAICWIWWVGEGINTSSPSRREEK